MKSNLELVPSSNQQIHKEHILLPRYPLHLMTFKCSEHGHTLEICDISTVGMQVENKLMNISWKTKTPVLGTLRFQGKQIDISAEVIWVKQGRAGLKFTTKALQQQIAETVLDIGQLVSNMRALHLNVAQEKPLNLKYWFQANGPLEWLIWSGYQESLSSCLWIYSHFFVQWNSREGIKTGRIYRQRGGNDDWNLMEGECVLLMDPEINEDLMNKLSFFMTHFSAENFHGDDFAILKAKLVT